MISSVRRRRKQVALNFHTAPYGGSVVVFAGEAYVEANPVPADQMQAYLTKYAEGIKLIGMTPESMMQSFSTLLRVGPTRLRAGE